MAIKGNKERCIEKKKASKKESTACVFWEALMKFVYKLLS